MLQYIKSKLPSFKDSAFGWDGLSTFIFSNVLMLVTVGLMFFWLLFRVMQIALTSSTRSAQPAFENNTAIDHRAENSSGSENQAGKMVLVAGLGLQENQLTDEFRCRLDRAIALLKENQKQGNQVRIIILGGLTGDNQITEARAGADYLLAQGVAANRIILEDQSRHTLENMQHARRLLLDMGELDMDIRRSGVNGQPAKAKMPDNLMIISSRYHLYRVVTLAGGLGMILQAIAAESSRRVSWLILFRMIKEAYYLHWYWSGKLWVLLTANHKSQARIS